MIHRRRPLYSACTEDTVSELRALEIDERDTVIAVCAGGGRVLSLLSAGPEWIMAVDPRADQLFQLELKAASIDALDYHDFVAFIGLVGSPDRRDIYAMVRGGLTASARRYWDRRSALIEEGALYAGRAERSMSGFVRWLRRIGALSWAERYFEAADLAEQQAMIEADGDRLLAHAWFWRVYCHPLVVYVTTQDPGFFRSSQGSVGSYLHRCFVHYTQTHLLRKSYFLHLLYFGAYPPEGPLPPYLEAGRFAGIKKCIDRLELRCARLEDQVRRFQPDGRVKWSLSDISGWMEEASFADLLGEISVRGGPGSRLCSRSFAAWRPIPTHLQPRLRRLDGLCDEIDRSDTSVVNRFEIAEYGFADPF